MVALLNTGYKAPPTGQVFVNLGNCVVAYEIPWEVSLVELFSMDVPNGERIAKTIIGKDGQVLYLTEQNHLLNIGIPEDDPSNTYADVLPQYSLIQDSLYEILKEDFEGNLKFYNGFYLVTMDNKCYEVRAVYPDDWYL